MPMLLKLHSGARRPRKRPKKEGEAVQPRNEEAHSANFSTLRKLVQLGVDEVEQD